MEDEVSLSELIHRCEQTLFDFLMGDIALGYTFAALATTRFQMGLRESACQSRTNAETAYAAVSGFVTKLQDPSSQTAINNRLAEFRIVLDELAVMTPKDAASPKPRMRPSDRSEGAPRTTFGFPASPSPDASRAEFLNRIAAQ